MKIKWYGTASLLLESGDTRLLFDPYCKEYSKGLPPVPEAEATTAEAIFITHPHLDHFSDIDRFSQGAVRRVYVSENGIRRARENGHDATRMQAISPGDRFEIGPFTVKVFQSRHCVFDAGTVLGVLFSPKTYFCHFRSGVALFKGVRRYKIAGDVYAFEVTDGEKRVMILGSAGRSKKTAYPTGCDLLVFPYQGRTRMHRYMRKFLRLFAPKGVMIDHFDNAFPPFTHKMNTKKFAKTAQKELPGVRTIVPTEGRWYEV